jgi:sRNA-binding regulator protein Hfq
MGHLLGLKEYLAASYGQSIFDQVMESHETWEFHLHGARIVKASIVENLIYDLKVDIEGQGKEDLPKIQVKFLYQPGVSESVKKLVKIDNKVKALGLQPILAPRERYFVKNKTLFPFMKERQVVFFTLLEGEIIRGIVADFSRYEITVHLKGGVPVVILRHSIYRVQNKDGRSLLKSFQDQHKDWQQSDLYVTEAGTKQAKANTP